MAVGFLLLEKLLVGRVAGFLDELRVLGRRVVELDALRLPLLADGAFVFHQRLGIADTVLAAKIEQHLLRVLRQRVEFLLAHIEAGRERAAVAVHSRRCVGIDELRHLIQLEGVGKHDRHVAERVHRTAVHGLVHVAERHEDRIGAEVAVELRAHAAIRAKRFALQVLDRLELLLGADRRVAADVRHQQNDVGLGELAL